MEAAEVEEGDVGGGTDLSGEVVEVVEAGVVRGCGEGGNLFVEPPGREDEEAAASTCLEAASFGLPVAGDGFFLKVDDGEPFGDGVMDDDTLGARDGGGDEDDAVARFGELSLAVVGEGFCFLCGTACLLVLPVVEDLLFFGALEEEEGAEGGILMAADAQVEAPLQQLRELAPHQGTERVVGHVALNGVEHSGPLDDAVVVAGLEEGWERGGGRRTLDRSRGNCGGRDGGGGNAGGRDGGGG